MIKEDQKQKKQEWAEVILDPECPTFSESPYFFTYKNAFIKILKSRKSRKSRTTKLWAEFCPKWQKKQKLLKKLSIFQNLPDLVQELVQLDSFLVHILTNSALFVKLWHASFPQWRLKMILGPEKQHIASPKDKICFKF